MRNTLINRRYRLERRLELTPTTESHLAFDSVLHRAVVVQLPRHGQGRYPSSLEAFEVRKQIASVLHHRNIIATLDVGEDRGAPFAVTEYLGGDSLAEIVAQESPFDPDDVAILVEQVANALQYAHLRGIVHGRLRPDAIVVDEQGVAKVTGFGAAEGAQSLESLETSGYARHTVGSGGAYSASDDLYALAAIAFEMLTGEAPDQGSDSPTAQEINPEIPSNVSEIVRLALKPGAASRFENAGEFARALSGWRTFSIAAYQVEPEQTYVVKPEIVPYKLSPKPEPMQPKQASVQAALPAENAPDPSSSPTPRKLKWLIGLAILLVTLSGAAIYRSSDPQSSPGSQAIPADLQQLLTTAES